MPALSLIDKWKQRNLLLHNRWLWHLSFWVGYALFRFWPYYITVIYYPSIFLEYMLLSELMFVAVTYFTIWLYSRLLPRGKYFYYFLIGTGSWILYLCIRTVFQFYYLASEPRFRGNTFADIFFNNITVVVVYFLFITACKSFKDGYIRQQFEAKRKEEQLMAEVNNLKSQIAPHFLFNTLNNLYGLAVEKSDKLPDLMLRLSDLLRHSLYETQKPLVPINEEMNVIKSYIKLETLRLEDDLKFEFNNRVSAEAQHLIAPLILIVFIENAFKHAKLVQRSPVNIYIGTTLENDWFEMVVENNFNTEKRRSAHGIGLTNVKRRLEVLYPNSQHQLTITEDDKLFKVNLQLKLVKA